MNRSLISTVLWHDLFRFSRRAGRFEYWWGLILCCLIYPLLAWLPLIAIFGFVIGESESSGDEAWREYGGVLVAAILLGIMAGVQAGFAFLSLAVRRLHDMGQSGLLVLLAFVAAINLIFITVLGVVRGEAAANRWGDSPATWPID